MVPAQTPGSGKDTSFHRISFLLKATASLQDEGRNTTAYVANIRVLAASMVLLSAEARIDVMVLLPASAPCTPYLASPKKTFAPRSMSSRSVPSSAA